MIPPVSRKWRVSPAGTTSIPGPPSLYDMFGNGKTALKASIGRYASSTQAGLVETFRPVTAAVNSTTRAWTDTNGNFFPDCDQRNPLLNGECAAMANQSFGQLQIRTRPDPDLITGWGKRGYNWLASVSVDRELMPGDGPERRLLSELVRQFSGHRQPGG